jgi:hypothetical protein
MLEFAADPRSPGPDQRLAAAPDAHKSAHSLDELVELAVEPTLAVALRAVREMLGMEVTYLSEIVGDDMVLRELEGDGESFRLAGARALHHRSHRAAR